MKNIIKKLNLENIVSLSGAVDIIWCYCFLLSLLCIICFDIVDRNMHYPLEEGKGNVQNTGWETYWGKKKYIKMNTFVHKK